MRNLEKLVLSSTDIVKLFRNLREGIQTESLTNEPQPMIPNVPPEFSNWGDEQLSVRKSVALYDQTHHMTDLLISGPDALKLVQYLSTNSDKNFLPGRGNQMTMANEEGYYVADGIICCMAENDFIFNGLETGVDWIIFHGETGDFNVNLRKIKKSPQYPGGEEHRREFCRFQLQGPKAIDLIKKLNGGPIEDVKFFHLTKFKIGKLTIDALKHGMSGALGLEFWAPWDDRHYIRETIADAGKEFDLHFVGSRAYPTNSVDSGWLGAIVPAVYTSDSTKAFREWVPADSACGQIMLKGSYSPEKMEDYYQTPYTVGYGFFVKFDHDFIGRKALEAMIPEDQQQKVTLEWNREDVLKVFADMMTPDSQGYKYIDVPWPSYYTQHGRACYTVMVGEDIVGQSYNDCYNIAEKAFLSLAVIDNDIKPGNEVEIIWGEVGGGMDNSYIKPTKPIRLRAIVSPTPYSKVARESYATGWRTNSNN